MAVMEKAPAAAHVLMSAWTPAPPPLSDPAIASTRGTCGAEGGMRGVRGGRQERSACVAGGQYTQT